MRRGGKPVSSRVDRGVAEVALKVGGHTVARPNIQKPSHLQQHVEAGLERQNDAVDELQHLLQHFNNRLTRNNTRFVERYFEIELHIVLNFRLGNGAEYVACFQHANICRLYEDSTQIGNGLAG